jgi:hypothetical protein
MDDRMIPSAARWLEPKASVARGSRRATLKAGLS